MEVLDRGSGFGLELSDFFGYNTLILDPAILEYAAAAWYLKTPLQMSLMTSRAMT